MIIIPAIDLKNGQCVRLLQGVKEKVTVYSNEPEKIAQQWEADGAKLIHIVDLDGAFSGEQKNADAIMNIRNTVKAPLQVGGGIRKIGTIMHLLSAGINRIILGTAAIEDPDFLTEACSLHPGKILLGIDAKDGMVAIKGWEEVTSISAQELAKRLERIGIAGIIYTDISRDGMLTGPNIDAVREMVACVNIPIIASGGVSSIEDIRNLMNIQNLWGVITGKALYAKSLDLKEAIALAEGIDAR